MSPGKRLWHPQLGEAWTAEVGQEGGSTSSGLPLPGELACVRIRHTPGQSLVQELAQIGLRFCITCIKAYICLQGLHRVRIWFSLGQGHTCIYICMVMIWVKYGEIMVKTGPG